MIAWTALAVGCVLMALHTHYDHPTRNIDVVIRGGFNGGATWWKEEVTKRYSDAVIVFCHGKEDYEGTWVTDGTSAPRETIEDMVTRTRATYPDRRLVLIVCNPGGDIIPHTNVTYALNNVWYYPNFVMDLVDHEARTDRRSGNTVGRISEFIEQ